MGRWPVASAPFPSAIWCWLPIIYVMAAVRNGHGECQYEYECRRALHTVASPIHVQPSHTLLICTTSLMCIVFLQTRQACLHRAIVKQKIHRFFCRFSLLINGLIWNNRAPGPESK
ncbi:uncharacterized protein C8Q71DRAFT_189536 [Rhodofomes roseus]|uniref:Secreted protein n=1 Tax=Rhodofomes roseus TaxID=34475 RepID=A0ABQ8K8E7_9APHY|nr:uncharacterized protein C8Q71DRAFT_189536 [Rhodofomes roseus]KAH9833567.1 hypothetical protein C8Q71DRAFT_189536 [Rhodofomes roseus]